MASKPTSPSSLPLAAHAAVPGFPGLRSDFAPPAAPNESTVTTVPSASTTWPYTQHYLNPIAYTASVAATPTVETLGLRTPHIEGPVARPNLEMGAYRLTANMAGGPAGGAACAKIASHARPETHLTQVQIDAVPSVGTTNGGSDDRPAPAEAGAEAETESESPASTSKSKGDDMAWMAARKRPCAVVVESCDESDGSQPSAPTSASAPAPVSIPQSQTSVSNISAEFMSELIERIKTEG